MASAKPITEEQRERERKANAARVKAFRERQKLKAADITPKNVMPSPITTAGDAPQNMFASAIQAADFKRLKTYLTALAQGKALKPFELNDLDRLRLIYPQGKPRSESPVASGSVPEIVDSIYRNAVEEIYSRQAVGGKLTGADYAFLEKVNAEMAKKKTVAEAVVSVQQNIEKELPQIRYEAIHTAVVVMRTSQSGAERMEAVKYLTVECEKHEPPPEKLRVVVAQPRKVVPIESAVKNA